MTPPANERVRLQKFLADAGVASRRECEDLIRDGRVLINQTVVDTLPAFVNPRHDKVHVNGALVRPERHEYWILNKPKGVVCTNRDPAGRPRAVDFMEHAPVRLFPVGRLDADSTGLLLLTNDGELAQKVTHPRYGLAKTYRVEVRGDVASDLPAKMKAGVYLSDGKASASDVKVAHSARDRSALMITLREGRNRQVRRMLARLGHPVKKLRRVQIGPISVRKLPLGASRRLTKSEIESLRVALEEAAGKASQKPHGKSRRPAGKGSSRKRKISKPPGRKKPPPPSDEPPGRRVIT